MKQQEGVPGLAYPPCSYIGLALNKLGISLGLTVFYITFVI